MGQQTLPYKLAFKTEEPIYNILLRPENRHKLKRFTVAMESSAAWDQPELILQGFDWGALPAGAVMVDVGGGIGQILLAIAKIHPELRIVNQDRSPAIELAKAYWAKHLPTHVNNNLVELQVHDFFTAQRVKNADVFLLRHVLHNWEKEKAISILQHLREAATPTTKLVCMEKIVPDCMYNVLGASERTLAEFIDLLDLGGWKLVQVHHHPPPSPSSHLVAVPA
ncbi:S-adenosyl-L-methionine-dependent methyltransferase [Mycena galopus ATCC 62051]|nr:S-adenosyl-L-methionine-dependent methyltransferase [Mycena galopus ATCC 62051]